MSADKLPKPLPDINTPEGVTEVLKLAAKGREDVLPLVRKLFDPKNPGSKDLILLCQLNLDPVLVVERV